MALQKFSFKGEHFGMVLASAQGLRLGLAEAAHRQTAPRLTGAAQSRSFPFPRSGFGRRPCCVTSSAEFPLIRAGLAAPLWFAACWSLGSRRRSSACTAMRRTTQLPRPLLLRPAPPAPSPGWNSPAASARWRWRRSAAAGSPRLPSWFALGCVPESPLFIQGRPLPPSQPAAPVHGGVRIAHR